MRHPNVLLIICDHLSTRVVGAYGEGEGCTPNIDSVAANGVSFGRVYTTYPLCMPARASFWTGRYPHQTLVESNGGKYTNGPLPEDLTTVGEHFKSVGYRCVHFGKAHDFGTLKGFEVFPVGEELSVPSPHEAWPENYDTWQDNDTLAKCEQWLAAATDEPFVCVADINNPHNICGWVGANNSMEGPVTAVPVPGVLPELPDNFTSDDLAELPLPVRYICCTHNRQAQTQHWDETNYRHYIAAFRHYTQLADDGVGRLLRALEGAGKLDNTIVVVMADHGDSQTSHGLVTKQVHFYDEVVRVPFIIAGPGITRNSGVCHEPLGSLLDLFPTLCGLTGVRLPTGLMGVDWSQFLGGGEAEIRSCVAAEWLTEWGHELSPGRMIRSERYKYIRYLEGDGEILYDMINDPGEKQNLAGEQSFSQVLQEHREMLARHVEESGDNFFSREVVVDERWRSHEPGWQCHRGIAAPMAQKS